MYRKIGNVTNFAKERISCLRLLQKSEDTVKRRWFKKEQAKQIMDATCCNSQVENSKAARYL